MKNKLLMTTAIVSAALFALPAMADTVTVRQVLNGDATLSGVSASGIDSGTEYGGVYLIESGDITINGNSVFSGNNAETSGAIELKGSKTESNTSLTIKDSTFTGNTATVSSGAIETWTRLVDLNIDNTTFESNSAPTYGAVSIFAKNGVNTISNSQFITNHATATEESGSDYDSGDGGAIYLGSEAKLKITNTKFSGNTAGIDGGAIATRNEHQNQTTSGLTLAGVANSENSVFSGNQANSRGGAIYANISHDAEGNEGAKISNYTFSSNSAANGGAIYNDKEDAAHNVSNLSISDSTFIGNTATTGDGGAIYNSGILTIAGTTVFEGNKAGETLNDIHNTGTVTLKDNVSLDGGISGNGTLVLADGMTLNAKAGTTKIENNVENNGGKLALTFDTGFGDSEYTLVTGSMNNEFAEDKIEQNSLYDIKAKTGVNGTYTITKKSNEEISGDTGADANQAAAISAVIASGDTGNVAFDAVANTINEQLQSGDAAQVQAALDTITEISPEVAPVAQSVTTETTTQVFSAIGTRLSGGATAAANQGMSSGDSIFEKGAIWLQTLFNHAKLDNTSKAPGFKADTTGVALGIEKEINDEVKAGIGYAYNDSDIKNHLRKTDVDTHTAFVYGEYKPSDWFINGMMSYNWSEYDEKTAAANAKYDVDSTALQAMTGYNLFYGNTTVTPEAGLRYIHIDQESYRNSVGSRISGNKSDILTGVIGATVAQNVELENGSVIRPRARLAFTYDIKHDDSNSVVGLPNGSSYGVKGEALDRFGVETGLGLTAEINDKWEVSADYEYRFRDDYRDHTGILNFKYKF